MKHGRKPTVRQRDRIKSAGLNPENWLVTKNLPVSLHLEHRVSGRERVIRQGVM